MERAQRSPITGAITVVALVFLFVPLIVVVLFSFHETVGALFPIPRLLAPVVPRGDRFAADHGKPPATA